MKKIAVLCLTLLAVLVFGHTLVTSAFYAPEGRSAAPTSLPPTDSASADRAVPARLIVPSLGIEARVEPVGENYKGDMASPSDYDDVSWYMHGTVPGERGSAVMAGHRNDGLGLSGVFEHLSRVRVGDEVVVEDVEGREARFVVERVETYGYRSVPLEEVFKGDGEARLNLITCAGRWTWDGRTYDERIVVYARLAE